MQHTGEIIALLVAISWTITALLSEAGVRRLGSLQMNVLRMAMAIAFLSVTLLIITGSPFPLMASANTWMWMALSGLAGYVFGDYCLFNSYAIIGSRFGQLFMTLSPLAAALCGWIFLGETLSIQSILGIFITVLGISLSILKKTDTESPSHIKLPLRGVLYGIGAGVGQGLGLTLSKIGMIYYEADIPADAECVRTAIPYAATLMRALIGIAGFIILLFFMNGWEKLKADIHDGKGIGIAILATIFGPFLGVSMSLMSVQYADAGIAATLMALTPVFIILPSWLFFKQKITTLEVVGATISVIGVALFFI